MRKFWIDKNLKEKDILKKSLASTFNEIKIARKNIREKVYFQIWKWPYATLNDLWGQSSSYKQFVTL